MREFLADVGGVYSTASCVILLAGYVEHLKRRKPIEFEAIVRGLGLAGVVTLFPVGFGIASALVALPFVGLYRLGQWLLR